MVFTKEVDSGNSEPKSVKGHFHNKIEVLGDGNYLFHWKRCNLPTTEEKSSLIPDTPPNTAHTVSETPDCNSSTVISTNTPDCYRNTVSSISNCNSQNINNVKVRTVPLLARKSIALPAKKIPFCPETYKKRPKYQAVFEQPLGNSGVDVKLLTVSASLDKNFLDQHCIENGQTKVAKSYKCWNCQSCKCEMLTLSGQSQQSALELKIVKTTIHLLAPPDWPKQYFAADFLYNTNLLRQLADNREQGLLQMINLERRLVGLSKNPKFEHLLEIWNDKFFKLFQTGLLLHEDDKRLAPYKNIISHFIRWSYIYNQNSKSSPLRPVSDLSHVVIPPTETTLSAPTEPKLSDIDKSYIPEELKGDKPSKYAPISFNQCLLKSLTTSCSVQRTFKFFRSYRLINLSDIKSFFWFIGIKLSSAKKMALWSRYPGKFGDTSYPWQVYYCANALFGASQSPVICENALFAACKNEIKGVRGCNYTETCNQVLQNTYVDNLLLGRNCNPGEDELTLFQLFSDLRDTIKQGSLALQDNIVPFFGELSPELNDSELQCIMEQTESYYKSLQHESTNSSRIPGGYPEFQIYSARQHGRINILEYLYTDQHNAFDYLQCKIKKGSVENYWEQTHVKINTLHPFPEKLAKITKNEEKSPKQPSAQVTENPKFVKPKKLKKGYKLNNMVPTEGDATKTQQQQLIPNC